MFGKLENFVQWIFKSKVCKHNFISDIFQVLFILDSDKFNSPRVFLNGWKKLFFTIELMNDLNITFTSSENLLLRDI